MADTQDTHSPEEPTRQDFPEVKDKTVNSVEVLAATEGLGITIRFHDESTLYFEIESRIFVSPVHSQWNRGEETVVRRWTPIQSTTSDS